MAKVRDIGGGGHGGHISDIPGGDERRDEAKRRDDVLAQEAEERASALEVDRMNPAVLRPDNEIRQHFDQFNELAVSNEEEGYEYCWVFAGRNSYWVRWKSAQGFEVVQGDMPEAQEHRGIGADSTRRVGDTILMRIRKDRAMTLRKRQRDQDSKREEGIDSAIMEMGERHQGIRVSRLGGLSAQQQDIIAKRAQARSIASSQFNDQIRQGTVPGLRPGGR
jgi:hypothetical protein